jgi:predicted amidophosphoribosyltransferase
MGRPENDIAILRQFVELYCGQTHSPRSPALCEPCRELLDYAIARRRACNQDPKPKCSECSIHCYEPGHRQRIKAVMKFGAVYYLKHGRLDVLLRLAQGKAEKKHQLTRLVRTRPRITK